MRIRAMRRGQVSFHVLKGRSLLWGALYILLAGVALRLLFLSGLGMRVDGWMLSSAKDPAFVTAIMRLAWTGRVNGSGGWANMLLSQSAFLADYEPRAGAEREEEAGGDLSGQESSFAPQAFSPPDFTPAGPAVQASEPPPTPYKLPEGVMEITFNPIGSKGYDEAEGVYVKNETTLKPDVAALLKQTPAARLAAGGPQILIVHTHGSEAYWPDDEYPYTPTDVERTEDTDFNVVRVGDEMQRAFEAQGLRVLHDRNIYDSPSYSGSYGRSLTAVGRALKEHPGITVVIDLHRDSIQSADGQTYKAVAVAGGQRVAQMMLVVGTNDSGLDHPNWKQNLTLALQLQKRLNEDYPGLMRPVNLRKERFNGHTAPGALLLEVGSSGNTLGEALASARLFAETAGAYLKQLG